MNSTSATKPQKLYIALFPWLAFGHMIPFLEVAKHIARRGHKVSFISTPRNIQRLPKIPQNLTPLITLVQIPLPRVENLPEYAEATMDVPIDVIPYLKIAHDGLENGISDFLQTHAPDWIIYDFAPYWLPPIAIKLGIKRAIFCTFNASTMCFLGSTSPEVTSRYAPRTKPEQYTVPPEWFPFPSKLCFKPFEAKRVVDGLMTRNASGMTDWFRVESTYQGCQVYFIRSCREIEGEWLDLLQDLNQKPVVSTGLLPPLVQTSDEDHHDNSWSRIAEWLDKQKKGEVVYVAFGSEINLSQEEFNELALGLELCGLPFFWVLRKPSHRSGDGDHSVKLPDGFEDRTNGRGLVWTTWAPQWKILAHESVGGFLSHCGWSSLIEALQYGRPLIMLPFMYDQGLIAKLWDKKTGIEVSRDEESGWFTRDELARFVNLVVVHEEGKPYRDGAKEYRELFRDKELHDRYMDECVEYLERHG